MGRSYPRLRSTSRVRAVGNASQTAPISKTTAKTATAGTDNAECTTVCPTHPPVELQTGECPLVSREKAPPGDKAPLSTVPINPRPTRNAGRAGTICLFAVAAAATMSDTVASRNPRVSPRYTAPPLAPPTASHRRSQAERPSLRTLLVQHYPVVENG